MGGKNSFFKKPLGNVGKNSVLRKPLGSSKLARTVGSVAHAGVGLATGGMYTGNGRGMLETLVKDGKVDPAASYGYSFSGGALDKKGMLENMPKPANVKMGDMPTYVEPKTLLDQNNNLAPSLTLDANKEAMNKLKAEAMSSNPSAWAAMLSGNADVEKANMISSNLRRSTGQGSQAENALMSTSGMSEGAQKRIQEQVRRKRLMGDQAISRQNSLTKENIMTSDQQMKDQTLQMLPQLETLANKDQQTNIVNTLSQKNIKDLADLERYKTQMGSYTQAKTAGAMANSGGGGKK